MTTHALDCLETILDRFKRGNAARARPLPVADAALAPLRTTNALASTLTLYEFFERWFVPIALRRKTDQTVVSYRESLETWCELTGDPPLEQIDDFTIATFDQALQRYTWSRGPRSRPKPLALLTQIKHLRQVRAVLSRTVHQSDRRVPSLALLDRVPLIELPAPPRQRAKAAFSIEQARAVWHQAQRPPADRSFYLQRWEVPPAVVLPLYIALLYYTGLRKGTILDLDLQAHVVRRNRDTWLEIPASIVKGRSRSIDKYVHPHLAEVIDASREWQRRRLVPFGCCPRHVDTLHARLQPADSVLSPHAWRRTHAREIGLTGFDDGTRRSQHALDHASSATTRAYYIDLEAEAIRRLPRLDEGEPPSPAGPRQQLELF